MRVGGRTDSFGNAPKKPFSLTVHYDVFTAWYELKSLLIIRVNLTHASCAVAQAVGCRPIAAETAGRS